MRTYLLIFVLFSHVFAEEDDFRMVQTESGIVRGDKYWNGDYYEFYGIPYAKLPTGRNRFKGPEPADPWEDVLFATNNNILCHQCYYTEESNGDVILAGDDKCLTMNVLVPKSTTPDKLVPVVVYIHSGAFSGGSGNMAKFGYLARHDIIVVSFNYRVGAYGFACLGNEEIPGNAGLKDQVAALRWIKKNIKAFGGDPDKITLAGFSVGAAMAELLALSKATDGIISQLILESGSALSPFTINRDPVSTAWNIALSAGYNGTANLDELTDFYLNVDTKEIAFKSLNYFLPNSTFGFAPCIEKIQEGVEAVITESPYDILKRGDYHKIPVLTGFSNMEGLSRSIKFGSWREGMNENFVDFLPADLKFPSEKEQQAVISQIKQRYFNNKNVTAESLPRYVDYFSDSMFKYSLIRSAKLHAAVSQKPLYLYEFSYVGGLNIQHNYMDRIKGASHRDQTAYLLDFFGYTNNYRDLDTRERMTTMWTDYVQYGNPTEYESHIISVKWPTYTKESEKYLEISKRLQVKQSLFKDEFNFWNNIYEKYYWNPTTVVSELKVPVHKDSAVKKEKVVVKKDKKPEVPKPQIKKENTEKKADAKVSFDDNKTKESTKPSYKDDKIQPAEVPKKENIKTEQNQEKDIKKTAKIQEKQDSDEKMSTTESNKAGDAQTSENIQDSPTLKSTTTIKSRGEDGKLKTKVINNINKSVQNQEEAIKEEMKQDKSGAETNTVDKANQKKEIIQDKPTIRKTTIKAGSDDGKVNTNNKASEQIQKESSKERSKQDSQAKAPSAETKTNKNDGHKEMPNAEESQKKIKTNVVVNADTIQVEDATVKKEHKTPNAKEDLKREEETVKIKEILAQHEAKEK